MTYATLRSYEVVILCDRYLIARDNRVEAYKERMIQEELNRPRLFERWRKPRCYDSVREELENSPLWGNYKMETSVSGMYYTERVKDIRKLASGSIEIQMSPDDYSLLEKYRYRNVP